MFNEIKYNSLAYGLQCNKSMNTHTAIIFLSFLCCCGKPCEGNFILDETDICVNANNHKLVLQDSINQVVNFAINEYSQIYDNKELYNQFNNNDILLKMVFPDLKELSDYNANGVTYFITNRFGNLTNIEILIAWNDNNLNDYCRGEDNVIVHEILHVILYLDLGKKYYKQSNADMHPDYVFGKGQLQHQIMKKYNCQFCGVCSE